jgi:hypothetical protein
MLYLFAMRSRALVIAPTWVSCAAFRMYGGVLFSFELGLIFINNKIKLQSRSVSYITQDGTYLTTFAHSSETPNTLWARWANGVDVRRCCASESGSKRTCGGAQQGDGDMWWWWGKVRGLGGTVGFLPEHGTNVGLFRPNDDVVGQWRRWWFRGGWEASTRRWLRVGDGVDSASGRRYRKS